MCLCIVYMPICAYAHTHLQAHFLMRALTPTRARTHARTRIHMYSAHTGARAQTRMHPGTRRPDYARTHAPAHEHVCMRTHTRKHTCTCKHAHAHPRYAHVHKHMQVCVRTAFTAGLSLHKADLRGFSVAQKSQQLACQGAPIQDDVKLAQLVRARDC